MADLSSTTIYGDLVVNGKTYTVATTMTGTLTLDNDANFLTLQGDTDSLIFSQTADDFSILNNEQNNGIVIHDGTAGVEIHYNGSSVVEVDSAGGMNVVSGTIRQGGTAVSLTGHSHTTGDVTSGTFADARIAQSNVTQHQAAINHDALSNFVANEHIDWTTDQGATNIHANNITGYSATGHQHVEADITNLTHLTIEEVQDNLGTSFLVGGTDISLSYNDVANTLTINSTATGVTDHGALTGLADDDHTQYHTNTRHDAHDHSTALGTAVIQDLSNVTITSVANDEVLAWNGSAWINQTAAEAGLATSGHTHSAPDHGTLSGLGDDDHTQYLNTSRHNSEDHSTAMGTVVLNDISDVTETTITSGDLLRWNGTTWVNYADSNYATSGHNHSGVYATVSHNHSAADITSGTLAVARGGTGIASYTTSNYIRASGATTLEQRTPAQVLTDIGAAASSHNHSAANITSGTLAVARGGTGIASYTTNNYIRASGATTLQQRTPAEVLSDIGAAAASHNHSATNITSGTLAVARGGTGIASYTTGNYIYASGATTLAERTPAQVLSDIGAASSGHGHTLSGDVTGSVSATVVGDDSHNHTGTTISALDTGDITTGTFANARISQGSVTQHQGAIDHGSIAGLGDDDHTIYSKADGTRAFTGTVGGVTPTANAHLTTKAYVDTLIGADTFLLMGA